MMKMNKLLSLILTFTLFASCAQFSSTIRLPASEIDEIGYYLSVDKFKYYLNEYAVALDGKVPDEIITTIQGVTVKDILNMHFDPAVLSDASNYDGLIFDFLKSKDLVHDIPKSQLAWNYNFFKTKLNEAYVLAPSKLDINLSLSTTEKSLVNETLISPEILSADDMTLDSGHYISNRTTRAVYWEAIQNERTIEFHLGDSREFLKQLKEEK